MRLALFSDEFVVPDKTRLDQRRAADPRASAWVSANAGAGKTKVLTDRVLRLLLSGSPPGRILCLTFTKAAAAEMALRVFNELGRWVTLDDADLADELERLEGGRATSEQMRRARRLFARSVETPGGLKIETIHAFCERILHLVPFEAGVPARFAVLDETQSNELAAQATASVLVDAASGVFPQQRRALDIVGVEATGDALAAAINAALKAIALSRDAAGPDALLAALAHELGLRPGETSAGFDRAMLDDALTPARCRALAARLGIGAEADRERAASLHAAAEAATPAARLKAYLCVFFKKDGEPYAATRIVTKAMEEIREELLEEQSRLVRLLDLRRAAQAVERTAALFALAGEIHARVERAKTARGALDFHDLIAKTLAVLSRGGSEWILYKLDRGIDHVLVDEAQDTNPDQWDILRRITEDFTAGLGARGEQVRTLFAVGDPKQSIFGFQGAAPQEFETNRRFWEGKLKRATLAFHDVKLDLSFRSGVAILSAVDATFAIDAHFRGLSYEPGLTGTAHTTARPTAPGLVELWPIETMVEEEEPDAWTHPVEDSQHASPAVAVARRIAAAVKHWTIRGDEQGRVWRAGDILILVRRRGPAFEAVIRALRQAGVPVAGADRIDIGEHIAVLDCIAAGRAALLPDDDLTLAAALKSPLVGLTDQDLVRLAARRPTGESLADALERQAETGDEAARRGCQALARWRALSRQHGPFGFYATLLGPMDGRSRLVARLGSEAGDALNAFLSFAHAAEGVETPSLITFLARFEAASHPIKRDLDAKRDEVRVMTVHGAKGLEAPIVIVLDGCEVSGRHPMRDPPLIPIGLAGGGTTLVWSCTKADDCARVAEAREAMHDKDLEEHNRLLYVAMTRAKDRLVIAPYGGQKKTPEAAWCEMVRRGLAARVGGLVISAAPYGPTTLWTEGSGAPELGPAPRAPVTDAIEAPSWLTSPVEPEPTPRAAIRPSNALGPDAATGSHPAGDARLFGTLTHTLLHRLPALATDRREAAARAFVTADAPALAPDLRERIVTDALRLLRDPTLAALFGPGSRAEVGVAGRVRVGSGEAPVSGQIDRLAVLPTEILIADYKTGPAPRPGRDAPEAYVIQLALYGALIAQIYPGRTVRPMLIWTREARIEVLTDAVCAARLAALATDDPRAP